ncbi:hypothetical protein [Lysinibacillus boronitolerans]|uniref:hypothetical protein n=1 Tax=Lysinibacillus boronitolerans TaxID=309788 RepID=UPI000FFB134D|nr:hypothetical protein [Lysinibacillus boronitolerans]
MKVWCAAMNLAAISDDFSEQMAVMTEGTRYDRNSSVFNCVPELEGRIREAMYLLWKDATSDELANYLERTAERYFQELYEFSYGVTSYDDDCWLAKGTERLALMIVVEKENRRRQIERLRKGYKRFNKILEQLPTKDNEVLQAFYMKRQKVEYELLRRIIEKHITTIEAVYAADTAAAEERTKEISVKIEGPAPKRKY